jgi:ribonuclease Z
VSFSVTILGSGAALPTYSRNPTSHYIQCNNRHILIDCGEGTQMQMRKYGVKFQQISHIFISHLHGDHFFGLVGLLSTMHLLGRDKGVTIYAPSELEQIIKSQLEIGGSKLGFGLTFIPISKNQTGILFEDRLIEIHTFPLVHKIQTNGFLIKEKQKERTLLGNVFKEANLSLTFIPKFKSGENVIDEKGKTHYFDDYTINPPVSKSYAFCSDTAYSEKIIPFIKDVDLLYHEATFTEKEKDRAKATKHSTAADAAKIAQLANAKKLILGHLSARFNDGENHIQEASEFFKNVEVVEDGNEYHL